MSQQDLLKRVVARLDEAGIDYMLTGSVVSSLQGEPRATPDIDVVIAVRGPAREAGYWDRVIDQPASVGNSAATD